MTKSRPIPVWEQIGMDWYTYRHLPWEEKKKILRRLNGVGPVRGFARDVKHFFKWNLYERWRRPDYSRLLQAWCKERAERHTVWSKYPGATFDEHDKGYR